MSKLTDWIKEHWVDVVSWLAMTAMAVCLLWGIAYAQTWRIHHEPLTAEERAAVAAMTERILSATPRQLAGHDQDWDDAVRAAHRAACETHCAPRLFEYRGQRRTGHWKAISSEAKP
jgi:hypothetical protein